MYQALYRKWRPKTFDDVVGQSHITGTLKGQVSSGRLSHAYLFIGTRGTGKTSCAKILAKAVNCESPVDGNPCCRCSACLGIDDGSVTDVVEMDAASNNGVEDVRALRDEAVFSPVMVKKRVYIIDEVHMLSTSAFNALLKILEEPPEHLMFILATTELHKVPATILSRCQRHSFKRLDMESITSRLQYVAGQEGLSLSGDAAQLIARLSEGGMRDALSLLDQCSARQEIGVDEVYSAMGLAGRQQTAKLLRHIAGGDAASALELFARLWQDGKDPSTLLGELSSLQRDVLMEKVALKRGGELLSAGYDEATISDFTRRFSTGALISGISTIQETLSAMRTGQARVLCELCLVRLCSSGPDDGTLRERVERLESALAGGAAVMQSPSALRNGPARPAKSEAPAPVTPAKAPEAPDNWDSPPPPEDWDVPPLPDERDAPPPEDWSTPPPRSVSPVVKTPPVVEMAPTANTRPAPPEPDNSADTPPLSEGTASGGWDAILPALEGAVSYGIYMILADADRTSGVLSGGTLTIYTEPGFTMNSINRPEILTQIAQAAGKAVGSAVRVKVAERSELPGQSAAEETKQPQGLDKLGKFDIVSFK